jgi:hypothetical protein
MSPDSASVLYRSDRHQLRAVKDQMDACKKLLTRAANLENLETRLNGLMQWVREYRVHGRAPPRCK